MDPLCCCTSLAKCSSLETTLECPDALGDWLPSRKASVAFAIDAGACTVSAHSLQACLFCRICGWCHHLACFMRRFLGVTSFLTTLRYVVLHATVVFARTGTLHAVLHVMLAKFIYIISCCLLISSMFSSCHGSTVFDVACSTYSSDPRLQVRSTEKLRDVDFLHVLPGHGRRAHIKDAQDRLHQMDEMLQLDREMHA